MTRENSETIKRWGEDTFGPVNDIVALVDRAQIEMDELREAVLASHANPSLVALEAADVTILLHRLVGTLGFDLSGLVDEKMTINRARTWTQSGDGTGQHTE